MASRLGDVMSRFCDDFLISIELCRFFQPSIYGVKRIDG